MKHPAAYIRVSSEEQAKEGFSLASQFDKCKALADARGIPEPVIYEDAGVSAAKERPVYQNLVKDIREGRISHVLFWRQDRLIRRLKELVELAELVKETGVELISYTENIDTSTAHGRAFFYQMGVWNDYFLELQSENIKAGLSKRAALGKWNTVAPTGGEIVDGRLVWSERARNVERAFELAADGMALHEVARRTDINPATLRGVLRNPVYIGRVPSNGECIEGEHEALVNDELFEAVQKMHPQKGRTWKKQAAHILSGTVRCGLCGRAMTVSHGGRSGEVISYSCRHRGGQQCKGVGSRSATRIERGFLAAAELLKESEPLQGELRDSWRKKKPPDLSGEIERTKRELDKVNRRVEKATAFMLEDEKTAHVWRAKLSELVEYQEILEAELDSLLSMTHQNDERVLELEEMLELFDKTPFSDIWGEARDNERRAILASYVEGIILYPEYMEIKFTNVPTFRIWWDEIGRKKMSILMERERRVA